MLIKRTPEIKGSEITDKKVYLSRRRFLQGALIASSMATTGWLYRRIFSPTTPLATHTNKIANLVPNTTPGGFTSESQTSFAKITSYNNFYEFSTFKGGVAKRAQNLVTHPWIVEVGGLCHKPKVFDIDELMRLQPMEERVYRMRCVEGWSMVIPWIGFPLARLLDLVEPLSSAKYVAFESLYDKKQMPNQQPNLFGSTVLDWPYREGLRIDEAYHPLTILAVGLYGETLPPQNGAPIRLVVPWKYGFKGIKSIVKINLTERQPLTTWNMAAPDEYGFYSNVNPAVSHPRWSQATERRIGEIFRKDTLIFNGYADQVANLYQGLDLKVNF